jgi:hypothetical protein
MDLNTYMQPSLPLRTPQKEHSLHYMLVIRQQDSDLDTSKMFTVRGKLINK